MAKKSTHFVFYRFINPTTGKEVTSDMPKHDWDRIQRDSQRRPHFTLIREVDLSTPSVQAPVVQGSKSGVAPVIEDELECPLCGYVAKNETGLKTHKAKKHG